jgi:hypothetical protein
MLDASNREDDMTEHITITPSPQMRAAVLAAAGLEDSIALREVRPYAPGGVIQTDAAGNAYCTACDGPIRWSTSYDEPHWVHVRAQDTLACPVYSQS